MASQELYGRVIEIVTGIQGSSGYKVTAEPAFLDGKETSLHVDFQAKYTTDGKPSKAHVVIINPPDQMVDDMLRGEDSWLSISAGYPNRFGVIFAGKPLRDGVTVSKTSGGDVKLKIVAHSGGDRYRRALAELSLSGRQTARSVVEQIVSAAGSFTFPESFWEIERNDIDANIVYPRGFVWSGNCVEALQAVAEYTQTELSIVGDKVRFLNPSPAAGDKGVEVTRFSSMTDLANLVGNVTRTDKGIKFVGLLEPSISPGDHVLLEFYDIRMHGWVEERIAVREVTYKGSNYGKNFFVECVGKVVRS